MPAPPALESWSSLHKLISTLDAEARCKTVSEWIVHRNWLRMLCATAFPNLLAPMMISWQWQAGHGGYC